MIGILLGIPIGIICSIISWWILFHGYAPKLKFSDNINEYLTYTNKIEYWFKIANLGNRNIIDIEIYAKLRIRGLYKDNLKVIQIITLDVGIEKVPILKPIKKGGKGLMKILKVSKLDSTAIRLIPKKLRDKYNINELNLRDILSIGDWSKLTIVALGYDEFSGSRKVFLSKEYTVDNLKRGKYEVKTLKIINTDNSEHDEYLKEQDLNSVQ